MERPILLTAMLAVTVAASAGGPGEAWTLRRGEALFRLDAGLSRVERLRAGTDTPLRLNRTLTHGTMVLRAEYGLTDRLTILGAAPFQFLSTSREVADLPGFADTLPAATMNFAGNLRFGARYALLHDRPDVLALRLAVESNNSDLDQFTGLQTGTDAWSFEPSVTFGRRFDHTYLGIEAGLTVRTNEHGESFDGLVEFGYNPLEPWWIAARVELREAFRNGAYDPCNMLQTGLYVDGAEYLVYGMVTWVRLAGDFGLHTSASYAVSGDRVPVFPELRAGVYWNPSFSGEREAVRRPFPPLAPAPGPSPAP